MSAVSFFTQAGGCNAAHFFIMLFVLVCFSSRRLVFVTVFLLAAHTRPAGLLPEKSQGRFTFY
jgi:hypothetical protein